LTTNDRRGLDGKFRPSRCFDTTARDERIRDAGTGAGVADLISGRNLVSGSR
jgi:hypothetical protein